MIYLVKGQCINGFAGPKDAEVRGREIRNEDLIRWHRSFQRPHARGDENNVAKSPQPLRGMEELLPATK